MGHDLSTLDKSVGKAFWFKRKEVGCQLPSRDAPSEQIVEAIQSLRIRHFRKLSKRTGALQFFTMELPIHR